jgi:hypothetical protein
LSGCRPDMECSFAGKSLPVTERTLNERQNLAESLV